MVSAERAADLGRARGARPRLAGGYLGARARAGRPDRLADAEPDRAARSTTSPASRPACRRPAQLPLHAPRDRPRAGGERSLGDARPRRAGRGSRPRASASAGWRGVDLLRRRRGRRRGSERLETLIGAETPGGAPAARAVEPAAIFFTSGSTGPAKGVTHTHESLRWMIASAIAAFGLTAEDVFLPGSSMSHIGSFLWALSTLASAAAWSSPAPTTATSCCRCCASTADGAGDDPRRARGADPRPRPRAGGLRLPADLPRRGRQGLDRAADRVRRARRLPDRRGLRHDRGRPRDAQPALGRDQAGLDRAADRRLQHRDPRRGRRLARARVRRPRLDQDPQPDGRLLGGAEATAEVVARAGSTPATSPAPTRTATSGSSAARSR